MILSVLLIQYLIGEVYSTQQNHYSTQQNLTNNQQILRIQQNSPATSFQPSSIVFPSYSSQMNELKFIYCEPPHTQILQTRSERINDVFVYPIGKKGLCQQIDNDLYSGQYGVFIHYFVFDEIITKNINIYLDGILYSVNPLFVENRSTVIIRHTHYKLEKFYKFGIIGEGINLVYFYIVPATDKELSLDRITYRYNRFDQLDIFQTDISNKTQILNYKLLHFDEDLIQIQITLLLEKKKQQLCQIIVKLRENMLDSSDMLFSYSNNTVTINSIQNNREQYLYSHNMNKIPFLLNLSYSLIVKQAGFEFFDSFYSVEISKINIHQLDRQGNILMIDEKEKDEYHLISELEVFVSDSKLRFLISWFGFECPDNYTLNVEYLSIRNDYNVTFLSEYRISACYIEINLSEQLPYAEYEANIEFTILDNKFRSQASTFFVISKYQEDRMTFFLLLICIPASLLLSMFISFCFKNKYLQN